MRLSMPNKPRPTLARVGALAGLLILCTCFPTEPSGPYGTYSLTACLFLDSVPQPAPCAFEEPTPGDSVRFDSGTFVLRVDSTWARATYLTYLRSGTWGSSSLQTAQGTHTPLPVGPYGQVFQLHIPGVPDDPHNFAVVQGDTLEAGVLRYTYRF
jgi:hypothetical protein